MPGKPQKLLTEEMSDRLRDWAARPGIRTPQSLNGALRLLAKWRCRLIENTIWHAHRGVVYGGPFAGMRYLERPTEGGLAPRLLGSYESELHPFIERFIAKSFRQIAVVGSAEGFYAVGLALRCPQSVVLAFDTDAAAAPACRALAQINGAAERVLTRDAFVPDLLDDAEGTFILCDIEGAEADLIDPVRYPVLRIVPALIVECHEAKRRGVIRQLTDAFASSHHVELVRHAPTAFALPDCLQGQSHLDQLLALWEWRMSPTPWLVMERKAA